MTRIPESGWEWFGYPGHLCVASRCQFRMLTRVGKYVISSVGDYFPDFNRVPGEFGERETIGGSGPDQFFETYVFRSDGTMEECGCCPQRDYSEIDSKRTSTATEARDCHKRMCNKYAEVSQ